jgi:cbb3-type cytochrome oxidase subunit 3
MGWHIVKGAIVVVVASIVIGILAWAYSPRPESARDHNDEATSKLTAEPDQVTSTPLKVPVKGAPASNRASAPAARTSILPLPSLDFDDSPGDSDG